MMENTLAILNQSVADLYASRIALHQVHWYMRGAGFSKWHPKMDKYMDFIDETLDEMSERLITLGGAPYSTLTEFIQYTKIEEAPGKFQSVEDSLKRVIEIFQYLTELFQEGLDVTDEDGENVTNSLFEDAKGELEKNLWMLSAELGLAPQLASQKQTSNLKEA
ncbi:MULTISPECIES: Dps family protein [unclassified Streptococcus]|uniref:Dps family protein n=1 Tax=unclassified Streptococcus TaxID=2608887 RepID=UPI0018AB0C7C|nr:MULTISPECIES: Dps family protein [unclassified Streptococcus]MBF8970975.1 DNA starvation/stationary phase protection protein [Streptococcus sp. NLN76]MBG9368174.1 DNA starvation/stationary phase protection protein [Streptococcus sp. NLN64]MBJ6746692.1 DNA starvation/stationary phase protection protein [Streptococcus sp. 121]